MIILIAITIAIVTTVIMKKKDEGFDRYIIKKGKHYSYRNQSILPYKVALAPQTLRFEAIFSDGCDYDLKTNDQQDINKLYGISFGMDDHYRSVRIGWRWNVSQQNIELLSYWYTKGKRYHKYLCSVKQYEPFFVTLDLDQFINEVDIQIKDEYQVVVAQQSIRGIDKSWIRFKLFPFFGGNIAAPHQITIFIREI